MWVLSGLAKHKHAFESTAHSDSLQLYTFLVLRSVLVNRAEHVWHHTAYTDLPEVREVGPVVGRQSQQGVLQVQQLAAVPVQQHIGGVQVTVWDPFVLKEL